MAKQCRFSALGNARNIPESWLQNVHRGEMDSC